MSDVSERMESRRIHVTHNAAEVRNWLLTSAGNVYLLSSLGDACEFESEAESSSGYRDSLDAYRADPDLEAVILRAVQGERAEKANTQAISGRLFALRSAARERSLDANETQRLLGDASLLLARVEHLQEYCDCRDQE